MKILLFEDEWVHRLAPAVTSRPAYAITCGARRLIDWISRLDARIESVVRPHLRTIQELDFPNVDEWAGDNEETTLFVNAAAVPSRTNYEVLRQIASKKRFGVLKCGNRVAAALIPEGVEGNLEKKNGILESAYFDSPSMAELNALGKEMELLEYPHDIVRQNLNIFDQNLEDVLDFGQFEEVRDNVFLGPNAQLGEHLVFDTSQGPVVIDESAKIGSYTYFKGPVYVGPHAKVLEHAAMKDAVSLSHTTKIGGEVEASVIEPYTNKQHHGFLGHSYLGSWINLGAGTCNSDLKNTYGEVKMDYSGERISSGMQFLGCIMGDYSKTAINTGIFTGKVIGLASMLYGFVTTNVPSFVNYARLFGQVTEMSPDVMVATQKRMFARRNVAQRPCDIQLIHDLYDLTRHERQIAGEPLAL